MSRAEKMGVAVSFEGLAGWLTRRQPSPPPRARVVIDCPAAVAAMVATAVRAAAEHAPACVRAYLLGARVEGDH